MKLFVSLVFCWIIIASAFLLAACGSGGEGDTMNYSTVDCSQEINVVVENPVNIPEVGDEVTTDTPGVDVVSEPDQDVPPSAFIVNRIKAIDGNQVTIDADICTSSESVGGDKDAK